MRKSLSANFPELFRTMQVPSSAELVANQFRPGGRENAAKFFLEGMTSANGMDRPYSSPALFWLGALSGEPEP